MPWIVDFLLLKTYCKTYRKTTLVEVEQPTNHNVIEILPRLFSLENISLMINKVMFERTLLGLFGDKFVTVEQRYKDYH